MCKKGVVLMIMWLLLVLSAIAQSKQNAGIRLLARPQQNKVLLRWAVDQPVAWKATNQYGFEVWRFTVVRDGKILTQPTAAKLSTAPVKPRPEQEWADLVQKDNNAAVIAQALYGTDFVVGGGNGNSNITSIVGRTQEQDQRFALALYAADNSFEAAKLAGWAWEDKTAQPNEKYLYKIRTLVPVSKMKIDSATVFTSIKEYQELPAMPDFTAVFGDRTAMLSWNNTLLKSYYNSWVVERSADGGQTFQRATALPVTNFNAKEKKLSSQTYFSDTLANNTTIYQFRLRGISPFGETGPPSKVISGKGKHLLAFVPNIRTYRVDEKGSLELTWEFDTTGNKLITGFALNQADKDNGPYKMVINNIPAGQRSVRYDELHASNYFTITAVAREGQSTVSFPALVQPVDSIPPAPPEGLSGEVDSLGHVRVTWKANQEKDMLGYQVLRGNHQREEFSLLDTVRPENFFVDSINIKTLNRKIYYQVMAVDQRYNQSAPSAVLEIKRPDIVPPNSPVITRYKYENNVIVLEWTPSSSDDVAAQLLYRKEGMALTDKWSPIKTFGLTTTVYSDGDISSGNTYSYLIIAKDSSGLESKPTPPIRLLVPVAPKELMVKSFDAQVNKEKRFIQLNWNSKVENLLEYQVYKGVAGKGVSLWKVLPPAARTLTDEGPVINNTYEYSIRCVLKDGTTGTFKTIQVIY